MYVPIIIDPCSFYDFRYLWEYLKYLYHCYENQWPIISIAELIDYRVRQPISNVYEESFFKKHQYRILTQDEEACVKKYAICPQIFSELEQQIGSKLGAKLFLLTHRYKPLEKEIKKILSQITKDSKEKIKGILNWNAHFVSIRYVAEQMNIPVITNEFSVRFPQYYPLAYFCKEDIYGSGEVYKMYRNFKKCLSSFEYRLLYREEILALLLEKEYLYKIELMPDLQPEYEIGVAGCHPLIPTFFAKSTYTDLELIEDVRKQYSEEDILFRKHPGDEPYQAEYTLKHKDSSSSSIDFILKCKRITAQGSNVILEAMLWGKPAYTKDISPFVTFCEKNLAVKNISPASEEVLNFLFFVYFVPFSEMWKEAYMDWRIGETNVKNIYERHVQYYFIRRGIPVDLLDDTKNCYQEMIKYRMEVKES